MTLRFPDEASFKEFMRGRAAPQVSREIPSVQAPVEKKSKMNKTETAWAEILEVKKKAGEIIDYRYEAITLRLGPRTTYKPDFFVVCLDHFEIHETKGGYIHDDAMAKFKIAAEMYPFFRFKMIQRKKGSPFEVIRDL